jgi:antitoxin component YwqK of YwqJK toxin-antitoxin module
MKHGILNYFFIGLILAMSNQLIGQEQINQTDHRGRKQGEWKATFTDGRTRYTGQFRDDVPYGEFRYCFPSGELRSVNVFSQNGKVAHNKTYFENNLLMAEGKYFNQKKDSTWRFYSDIDGNMLSEEDYLNDLRHGLVKNYYPDSGKLLEVIHYKDGKKNGAWQK